MISPALNTKWQKTAQRCIACPTGACEHVVSCQHTNHAGNTSPFSAMVCRNHYPSPSSTRFSAFVSEPGLFSRISRRARRAPSRSPRKKIFENSRNRGKMAARTISERGSQKCSSPEYLRGPSPLSCWPGVSGTTFSVLGLAQPRVLLSQRRQAATFLRGQSSVRAQGRFAMMSGSASATDLKISGFVSDEALKHKRPAVTFWSGGLFYANVRGGSAHSALT